MNLKQNKTEDPTLRSFLAQILHGDTAARLTAIKQAPLIGTAGILPLAKIMAGTDAAAARAATDAFKRIVTNTTRPGAASEAKTACGHLLSLTAKEQPMTVRIQAYELLGLVGGADAVPALETALGDVETREYARLALDTIPDKAAEAALKRALKKAPADFKPALEASIKAKVKNPKTIGTPKK